MTDVDEEAVTALWEAGCAAFPEVFVDRGAFAGFVLSKAAGAAAIAALRPELYLACACAAGEGRAIALFEERYLARVPSYLAPRERSAVIVDEVRQIVRERLLVAGPGAPPKIAEYAGTGALEGWLRVVTLRAHANLRRQDREHEELDEAHAPAALAQADPEMALIRKRWCRAFDAALRDAFAALPDQDRAVLRMQFLRQLTLDQIALVFQVHRATVARWTAAARARLLAAVTGLLRARLGVDQRELASLMAALGSQLDLSLSSVLREPGGSA
jgi:RNA polymerase sigma-70 factor (ECF subfamily)